MTYAEWSAMSVDERNAMCAEKVMGWEKNAAGSCMAWHSRDTGYGTAQHGWSPATDRNATAMLVEEVCCMGQVVRFEKRYSEQSGRDLMAHTASSVIKAAPSLIAYCCVLACEEA